MVGVETGSFIRRVALATPSPRSRGEGRGEGALQRTQWQRLYPKPLRYSPRLVPETENAIAVLCEPLVAHGVAAVFGVLATIDLNHQPLLSTNKIDDIRPDRFLTHELEPSQRSGTKVSPKLLVQLALNLSAIVSQTASLLPLRHACVEAPSPQPSPRRRGEGAASATTEPFFLWVSDPSNSRHSSASQSRTGRASLD